MSLCAALRVLTPSPLSPRGPSSHLWVLDYVRAREREAEPPARICRHQIASGEGTLYTVSPWKCEALPSGQTRECSPALTQLSKEACASFETTVCAYVCPTVMVWRGFNIQPFLFELLGSKCVSVGSG